MPSFNKIVFLGNLTRDPDLKYLPNKTAVTNWGMASNRKWKTQGGEEREEVCFVDMAAFGRVGEIVNEYCKKGSQLLVEGRLKFETWSDKNTGDKRNKLSVLVENVQLLGGKGDGDSEGVGAGNGRAAPASKQDNRPLQQRVAERPEPESPLSDEPQFADSDIPF